MNQRFTELRAYVDQRFTELAARVAAVEARLTTMQWVLGFVVALEIAIFVKLFVH